jgi:hypothetical protein
MYYMYVSKLIILFPQMREGLDLEDQIVIIHAGKGERRSTEILIDRQSHGKSTPEPLHSVVAGQPTMIGISKPAERLRGSWRDPPSLERVPTCRAGMADAPSSHFSAATKFGNGLGPNDNNVLKRVFYPIPETSVSLRALISRQVACWYAASIKFK